MNGGTVSDLLLVPFSILCMSCLFTPPRIFYLFFLPLVYRNSFR